MNSILSRFLLLLLLVFVAIFTSASGFNVTHKLREIYIYDNINKIKQLNKPKPTVKIAIINSYSPNHPCTTPQVDGFIRFLRKYKEIFNYDIQSFYLRTKTVNTTQTQMDEAARRAIRFVSRFKPDIVYTTDDNAARLVGIPLSLKYTVISSGVNRPAYSYIHDYNLTPQSNKIIFVQELIRLDSFFNLLKESKIFISKAYILVEPDDMMSTTGYYMLQNYLNELRAKIPQVEIVRIRTAEQLRQFLIEASEQHKYQNVMLIIAAQRIYDDTGKLRPKTYYLKILKHYNTRFLELGGNPQFCKLGLAVCEAPSFSSMGKIAGVIAIDFLVKKYYKVGKQETYCSWTNGINVLAINEKRIRELGYTTLINNAKLLNIIY